MTIPFKRSWTCRGISFFVAAVFLTTTLIGDSSVVLAAGESLILADRVKFQKDLEQVLYSLPAEIGTISETYLGERGTGNGERSSKTVSRSSFPVPRHEQFIVHIQDAHANPEAQRNIYEILKFLRQKYPDLVVGIEGAAGPLHPEYLDLFREFPAADQAVIEDLRGKGELTGAELFAWEQYKQGLGTRTSELVNARTQNESRVPSPVLAGVETLDLYKENLKTYRELLYKRGEISALLDPVRAALERESSRVLNADLRNFLKERARRKNGKYQTTRVTTDADLQAYVRYLQKQVSKVLAIDLTDPIEQLRFPNLMRLILLEKRRSVHSVTETREAWSGILGELGLAARGAAEKELVASLEAYGIEKGFLDAQKSASKPAYGIAPALYPRRLLEQIYLLAGKRNVKLADRTALLKSFEFLIFQAEIDITGLMSEMSSLEEQLTGKLARTDPEKALVRKLENFELFEKLLSLELTRGEYRKILAGDAGFEAFAKNSKPLQRFLEKARHFYDGALQRDRVLVENALVLTRVERGTGNGERKSEIVSRSPLAVPRIVVLITGGFHTDGIREALTEKGNGYAVITPRISRTDRGEMYPKVMGDANADLTPYFKVKNPFATKQEALLFKEALEVAAPVLFETYQMKGRELAQKVQAAFVSSPVLSQAVRSELLQSGADPAVRFTPYAGAQILTPQTAAISAVPVTAAKKFAEAVAQAETRSGTGFPVDVSFKDGRLIAVPALTQTGVMRAGDLRIAFGTLTGRIPAVPAPTKTSSRSELREAVLNALEVSPSGATLAARGVVFKQADHTASLEERKELLPAVASKDERWAEALKQYKELFYAIRQLSSRLSRLVTVAQEREARAKEFIKAQDEMHVSDPVFQTLRDLDQDIHAQGTQDAAQLSVKQAELEEILRRSPEKESLFLAYLSATSVVRAKYGESTGVYAGIFFHMSDEVLSTLVDGKKKMNFEFFWNGQETNKPLSVTDLAKMTNEEIEAFLGGEDLKRNQWLRAMVAKNRSATALFHEYVIQRLEQERARRQQQGGNDAALQPFNDALVLFTEVVAELIKTETYQLDFRNIPGQEGFILIAEDPLSPQQYLKIRDQYGDRLQGIVMKATQVGATAATSHTKIIIQADFNPPAVVLLDGKEFDELVRQAEQGTENPLLLLTASGEKGQVVIAPAEEKREDHDREAKRKKLWQDSLKRWLSQAGTRIRGRFSVNLMPGNLKTLDRVTQETGLDRIGSGLYRTEMQTPGSFVMTRDMIRALRRELKGAATESLANPIPKEDREQEFFSWLERPQVQSQLDIDVAEMTGLLTHPALRGEVLRVRTEDLRLDKNEDLYECLLSEGVLKDKRVGGFDMYYTGFGRLRLLLRLTAILLANAQVQGDKRAVLEVIFPMIKDPEEIQYIKEQILPVALAAARKRLLEMDRNAAELTDEALLKGISFGIMLETPEAVNNLQAFLRDDFLTVFNGGLNDFQLLDTEAKLQLPPGALEREDTWYAIFIQQEDAEFMDKIYWVVKAFHDHNTVYPDHPKKICLCGEIASDPKYAPRLAALERIYPNAGLSVSMSPGRVAENVFARDQALRLELQGASQLREKGEQIKMIRWLDSRMQEAREIMIAMESWQQNYERHDFYLGLQRVDPDVVEGPGSAAEFLFLKSMVRAMLDNPEHKAILGRLALNANEHLGREELDRILDYLVERNILFAHEAEEIKPAFDFLMAVREVFIEQRKAEPQGPYAGKLVASLVPELLVRLAERGFPLKGATGDPEQDKGLFYQQYYAAGTLVLESVTRVIHELFYEVSEAQYHGFLTIEEVPIEEVSGPSEARTPVQILIRSRTGIQFSGNRGFYYGTARALHIRDADALFQAHPEWMVRIFVLAAKHNVHVSHRVQKALRRNLALHDLSQYGEDVRKKILRELKELLQLDQNIDYAMLRLHRFKMLDTLIPNYGRIRNRFLLLDQQYTADNLTLRTLEGLELFGEQKHRPFRDPGEGYRSVRANPAQALSLRLAILLKAVVFDELFSKGGQQPSAKDYQRKVAEHLTALGWEQEPALAARVAHLIYIQHFMDQRDFGVPEQKLKAVELLVLTMTELMEDPVMRGSGPNGMYSMIYAMAAASRVAHVAPENLILLLREGLRSALGSLNIVFDTVRKFVLPAADPHDTQVIPRFMAPAILAKLQQVEADLRGADLGFRHDQFRRIRGLMKGHDFQRILGHYLTLVSKEDQKSLRAIFEDIFSHPEILSGLYQRYYEHVSSYYESGLSPEEILQQLMHLAHLEWLSKRKEDDNIAMLATPLAPGPNQPYEMIISFPRDEPGVTAVFARVLKENGFVIENINPRSYTKDTVTIVFLGAFPDARGNTEEILQKMQTDMTFAFRRGAPNLASVVVAALKTKIGQVKTMVDARLTRLDDLYKARLAVSRPTGWHRFPTEVIITDETHGAFAGISRIEITTTDRLGLFAAMTALLAGRLFKFHHVLNVKGFKFDNTNSNVPKLLFWVEDLEHPGRPVQESVAQIIKTGLPPLFDQMTGFSVGEEPSKETAQPPAAEPPPAVTRSAEESVPTVTSTAAGVEWAETDYKIVNPLGFHLRPSSALFEIKKEMDDAKIPSFRLIVTTLTASVEVTGIFDLIGLAEQGHKVSLRFEGVMTSAQMKSLFEAVEAIDDDGVPVFERIPGSFRSSRSEVRDIETRIREALPGEILAKDFLKPSRSEMRGDTAGDVARWKRQTEHGITKVLIVDDGDDGEWLKASVESWKLNGQQVEVVGVTSGEAGLAAAIQGDFDFVWSDINMPGMNGVAMAKALHAVKPDLPIILWSGNINRHTAGSQMWDQGTSEEKQAGMLLRNGTILRAFHKTPDINEIFGWLSETEQHVKHTAQAKLAALQSAPAPVPVTRTVPIRSEVRASEPTSSSEVVRPLDMSPEESAHVKKILVFGPKGIGYEKLGEDIILYTFFIQQLLRKFPNAQVHIAIDYVNLFAHSRFQNRVVPVFDIRYEEARRNDPQQRGQPFEPPDGILNPIYAPEGSILSVMRSALDSQPLGTWLQNERYDMIFDFTAVGETLGMFFKSQRERGLSTPLVFSGMNTVVLRTGVGENVRNPGVTLLDFAGLRKNVMGTGNVGQSARDGKWPGYWEKVQRVYRELGLFPEGLDLQTLNGFEAPLDKMERFWVFETLRNMFIQNEIDPDVVLSGKERFIYVNIFTQGSVELITPSRWTELLSRILQEQDVFLIFSPGGFRDSPGRRDLDMVMREVGEVVGAKRKNRLLTVPENLTINRVQELMRIMDFVITPDTGFSHVATALNIPQIEFMGFHKVDRATPETLREASQWGTYRTHSLVADRNFLNHLDQYPQQGYKFLGEFVKRALAENPEPRRWQALDFGVTGLTASSGSTPQVRAELRAQDRVVTLPEGLLPESVDQVAKTLGTTGSARADLVRGPVYSISGVESYLPETVPVTIGGETRTLSSSAAVHAWVTWQVVQHELVTAPASGISNARLEKILAALQASMPAGVPPRLAHIMQGPQIHVNLSNLTGKDWEVLVSKFAVTLGTLVTLRGKLFINVNMDAPTIRSIEQKITDLAKREGIVLAPDQLRLIPMSGHDPFASLAGMTKADALVARDRGLLDQVVYRKGFGARWVTDDGGKMETLAAGLTTILYAALDERVDRINVHRPSDYDHGAMLTAVLNAIQGYLRIRVAA